MSPLEEVLRRYAEDLSFRKLLNENPATALRQYPLAADELAELETHMSEFAADPPESDPQVGM